jgi:tagaturonate reductase
VLGLAAIITYYKGGKRGDVEIVPNDDAAIIALLKDLWAEGDVRKVAEGVLAAEFIWGENLNAVAGLTDLVTEYLTLIQNEGMRAAVRKVIA